MISRAPSSPRKIAEHCSSLQKVFLGTEDSVKRNSRATTLANAAFSFSWRVVMFVRIVKALRSTAVKKSSSLPGARV